MRSCAARTASRCSGSTAITCMKAPSTPSPGWRSAASAVAEPGLTFAVADHYVPTRGSRHDIANPEIARMVRQIEENAAKHGDQAVRTGRPATGHRARGRTGTGTDLAGPADRLRRQPHLDARRARRLCIRDRRLRGRACADDADHLAAAAEDHADHRRRPRRARRRGEGHRARHHCPYRRRRRDRLRGRICRLRDQGAVDRRPAHALQHVDRGRRALRHDRARRCDVCLSQGPSLRARAARISTAPSKPGPRSRPTATRDSIARSASRPRRSRRS